MGSNLFASSERKERPGKRRWENELPTAACPSASSSKHARNTDLPHLRSFSDPQQSFAALPSTHTHSSDFAKVNPTWGLGQHHSVITPSTHTQSSDFAKVNLTSAFGQNHSVITSPYKPPQRVSVDPYFEQLHPMAQHGQASSSGSYTGSNKEPITPHVGESFSRVDELEAALSYGQPTYDELYNNPGHPEHEPDKRWFTHTNLILDAVPSTAITDTYSEAHQSLPGTNQSALMSPSAPHPQGLESAREADILSLTMQVCGTYRALKDIDCYHCGTSMFTSDMQLHDKVSAWLRGGKYLRLHMECLSCGSIACLGCWGQESCRSNLEPSLKKKALPRVWQSMTRQATESLPSLPGLSCENARISAIRLILIHFDKESRKRQALASATKSERAVLDVLPSGTGYSLDDGDDDWIDYDDSDSLDVSDTEDTGASDMLPSMKDLNLPVPKAAGSGEHHHGPPAWQQAPLHKHSASHTGSSGDWYKEKAGPAFPTPKAVLTHTKSMSMSAAPLTYQAYMDAAQSQLPRPLLQWDPPWESPTQSSSPSQAFHDPYHPAPFHHVNKSGHSIPRYDAPKPSPKYMQKPSTASSAYVPSSAFTFAQTAAPYPAEHRMAPSWLGPSSQPVPGGPLASYGPLESYADAVKEGSTKSSSSFKDVLKTGILDVPRLKNYGMPSQFVPKHPSKLPKIQAPHMSHPQISAPQVHHPPGPFPYCSCSPGSHPKGPQPPGPLPHGSIPYAIHSHAPPSQGPSAWQPDYGDFLELPPLQPHPQISSLSLPKSTSKYSDAWLEPLMTAKRNKAQMQHNEREAIAAAIKKRDELAEQCFTLLTHLIKDSTDFQTDAISKLLMSSTILDVAAELLRNDSVEDAVKRRNLYAAVMSLAEALAERPAFADIVFRERPAKHCSQLLQPSTAQSDELTQKVPSLHQSMSNLVKQCTIIDKSATKKKQQTPDLRNMFKFTHWLLQNNEQLSLLQGKWLQTDSSSVPIAPATVNRTPTTPWQTYHQSHALLELPDNLIFDNHHYKPEAFSSVSRPAPSSAHKTRLRRLLTETATLSTSLPPGIFVRTASSRPDLMKCLILGPADTPYAHGLFEFDIYCPPLYPSVPPKCHFRTTGGGRAHFNPNLYENGKVCLSLLGTWAGTPWDPAESTILQVLVSLQALVLCAEPWFNEPGREHGYTAQKEISEGYNRKLQVLTIRFAMEDVLEREVASKREKKTTVWGDVVGIWARECGGEIDTTVNTWIRGLTSVTQQEEMVCWRKKILVLLREFRAGTSGQPIEL